MVLPILVAFKWQELKPDALIVDVGGGTGGASLPLVLEYPQLRLVVQDMSPGVVEMGKQVRFCIVAPASKIGLQCTQFVDHTSSLPKRHPMQW